MKLPHKIRISPRCSYEIAWVERFDCDATLGECRFESKQIVLKDGQSDTEIFKTLVHEIFHAIEFEYKITIPHKSIYALEHAIHRILKLNKWMPK